MIIWGSRTARNAKGVVVWSCPSCAGERVHLVVEVKTKFTLYFVPTFTTSKKAILVCTQCERLTQLEGPAAGRILDATVSREQMVDRLGSSSREPAAPPPIPGVAAGPSADLAVAFLIMLTTVALADRRIEQREVATGIRSLSTIAAATTSPSVRDAAALARDRYDDLMSWIQAPDTGPLSLMLARAGTGARSLAHPDQMRCFGQLAWLGHEVAAVDGDSSGEPDEEALDRIDDAFLKMGVSAREAADALAFCERYGG